MADNKEQNEKEHRLHHNPMEGNADSITRAYLDTLVFEERLIDSVEPSTELTLFGRMLSTPS